MRYHIFDSNFPRKSKTAGFYCDCGMETREVGYGDTRRCTLATLRRAHLACRCPLWRARDIRPKRIWTWQKTLDEDYKHERPKRDRGSRVQRTASKTYAVGTYQL